MVKISCPCCQGKGEIEDDIPLFLTPMQTIIYKAVRDTPGGIGGGKLIDRLYGNAYDGGPDYPWDTIHATIHNMNKRLAAIGEIIKADRRGAGAVYRIHKGLEVRNG